MHIDESVYWDVDKIVSAKFVRGNAGRVGSDVGAEVVSGDGEGV